MKQKNLLEHKVGIRILRENTLENIFPMYLMLAIIVKHYGFMR